MEIKDTVERIRQHMSEDREITVEEAQAVLGMLDTGVGQLIMQYLDWQEFSCYENDIQEKDHAQTLINKGYIQGIRSLRAFFQSCATRVEEHQKEEKRKENNARNR